VQLRFREKGRGSAAPIWGRAGVAAWRKRSGSEAERGEELRASGGGGFPVKAVLRGEAARGGEGRGSGGQEGTLVGGGVGRVATRHCSSTANGRSPGAVRRVRIRSQCRFG
jgi:hypothetical protein